MRVKVYEYVGGDERKWHAPRYLDEVIEQVCVGTESELDAEYDKAMEVLKRDGRVWLSASVLLTRG